MERPAETGFEPAPQSLGKLGERAVEPIAGAAELRAQPLELETHLDPYLLTSV